MLGQGETLFDLEHLPNSRECQIKYEFVVEVCHKVREVPPKATSR